MWGLGAEEMEKWKLEQLEVEEEGPGKVEVET